MAGSILQIPESTLASIEITRDDAATLAFQPALRIKSEGVPGVDASTLWRQSVNITLSEAEWEGAPFPEAGATVASGEITVNGLTYQDIIPLPLDTPGHAEVILTAQSGESWTLSGSRIVVELLGVEKYLKHLDMGGV